jgi:hypothetical protein
MNQKFRNKYAVVQETATVTDMVPIFTSIQNKGVFVVLLFGVVKKTLFAKITFSLLGVLTFHLLREAEGRNASCSADLGLLASTW